MAFPQKRSSSFLSDSLVAFSRYPVMTAFAGAATLMRRQRSQTGISPRKRNAITRHGGGSSTSTGFICTMWSAAMAGRWFFFTAMAA
jgi:hypothetical protein